MAFIGSRAKFSTVAFAALCSLAAFAPQAQARPVYMTFDVPGAARLGWDGVNRNGAVFGSFQDERGYWHGFVRTPDGNVTTFDAANASNTYPEAINDDGVIVGYMQSRVTNEYYGFLRNADGSFVSGLGIVPISIDDRGAIFGTREGVLAIRSKAGKFKKFPVQGGSVMGACLNHSHVIAGTLVTPDEVVHGFVRASDGTVSVFDAPNATMTNVTGIDDAGDVAGWYLSQTDDSDHAFLRKPDGTIMTVDPNGASSAQGGGMDRHGSLVGTASFSGTGKAFIRDASGRTRIFAVPGALQTDGMDSDGHNVAGLYNDANGQHGFLRIQQ